MKRSAAAIRRAGTRRRGAGGRSGTMTRRPRNWSSSNDTHSTVVSRLKKFWLPVSTMAACRSGKPLRRRQARRRDGGPQLAPRSAGSRVRAERQQVRSDADNNFLGLLNAGHTCIATETTGMGALLAPEDHDPGGPRAHQLRFRYRVTLPRSRPEFSRRLPAAPNRAWVVVRARVSPLQWARPR